MNWRLLDTGINEPQMNMAIDEALLLAMKPDSLPMIRFYDWQSSAISIGYSQKTKEVLDTRLCEKANIAIIRRPTGGGVVFHGPDLTYSIILPGAKTGPIQETYRRLQNYVVNGLTGLGLNTVQYPTKESPAGCCFISPNIGDIMLQGKKLGGMAARRIKQKILCQGYLYYDNAEEMAKYIRDKKVQLLLKTKAVYIREIKDFTKDSIKSAIIKNWPGDIIRDKLNRSEEELADSLCQNKYAAIEWIYKR